MVTDEIFEIVAVQAEAAKRGVLTMWTVYKRPKDYPTGFVARMFEVTGPYPKATRFTLKALKIEPLREMLLGAGLTPIARSPEDEAQIVESWI